MIDFLSLLLSSSALALCSVLFVVSRNPKTRRLPPGPIAIPIIGNALQIPIVKPWLKYAKWGKTWGDVVYVHVFGAPIVILNSYRAAVDLMEKRSAIYSSRHPLKMAELSGWGPGVAFTPYNDHLKAYRRMFHKALNVHTVEKDFRSLIESEVKDCLQRIADRPKDFKSHVRRMAAAVAMNVIYGYEIVGDHDPFIKVAEDSMEVFAAVTRAGEWLVDFLPSMLHIPKWFPGVTFKRLAEKWRKYPHAMFELPFAWTKKTMADGTAIPSFVSKMIEGKEDEELIKFAGGSLFAGGADTTVSAINTFFLAMSLYPHVQKKAQAEIDRVIGHDRLPGLPDRSSLPYVEAVVREVLRWNPVTPLGGPRATTKEDFYDEFYIPEGSIVIPNVWGMLHDERMYFEPMEFNPERFMPYNAGGPEMDPHNCAFGFGRRICPGLHIAKDEVFLAIAQILATFKIMKDVDEKGREIQPPISYSTSLVSQPEDFQCCIEPRSAEVLATIST